MSRWFSLFVFVFAVFGLGILVGSSTPPGEWYAALAKPPLNPPNWLFGPVWGLLYILIAVAGWRTWEREGLSAVFTLWAAQLALNFSWSPVVFTINNLGLGLIILLAMLACILAFISLSWNKDRLAALCFVPYAAWVAFAGYLNAGLYLLN